jgi:hypothetical protein
MSFENTEINFNVLFNLGNRHKISNIIKKNISELANFNESLSLNTAEFITEYINI